jgi:glycopeptide antibiotics resistance protein
MADLTEPMGSLVERSLLRWLLLLYCLFILYGSFIPFHFNHDPEFLQSQWTRFFTPLFDHGIRKFSIPDVLSNILLFVPFGFFRVGGEFPRHGLSRPLPAMFTTGVLGLLFGLVIESGQTFSPGRIASILDALCNGIGSALGALVGSLLLRTVAGKLAPILLQLLRQRPSVVLLVLLVLAAIADAYYPFEITLDVSTLWHNLKNTQVVSFSGGLRRFWLDLLVEKFLLFAAVGYLAFRNLPPEPFPARAIAWITCSALVVMIESGKLFFAGRAPNFEAALLGVAGVLCGVFLLPPLAAAWLVRRYPTRILTALLVCLIAYSELSPFDWVQSAPQIRSRIATIEWLPFVSYYHADLQTALFDLGKKMFLLAPFGFLIAAGVRAGGSKQGSGLAALTGLLMGAILEAGQLALKSRTPSVTDVLLFGAAAGAGAVVFERYRRIQNGASNCKLT